MTTIKELQREIFENKKKRNFNTPDISKEIILMMEELGELASAYKKSNKKLANEIDNKDEILDAIGDLSVYCLGLFEMLGIDGEKIIQDIVNNNKTRSHKSQI